MPNERDLLYSFDNGSAIITAVSFRSLTGMLSGPVDLFESRRLRKSRTSLSEVTIFRRVGTGVAPSSMFCCGSCLFFESIFACFAKWSLRSVAFFAVVNYNFPVWPFQWWDGVVSCSSCDSA